jgi:hypothetical protein
MPAMPKRGVIYMVWGRSEKIERALERSKKSVNTVHPELPVEVIRLDDVNDPSKGLLEKARMFERTPFQETLFLVDADTVVLGRLDFGFRKAQDFGLACSICECPWARRYAGIQGEAIEYNTGVLFFSARAKPVFKRWARLAPQLDPQSTFSARRASICACRTTTNALSPPQSRRRDFYPSCCPSTGISVRNGIVRFLVR